VNTFVIATFILFCVALGLRLYRRFNARRNAKESWTFYAKRPLAGPEQVLHQRLVTALPGFVVMSRVPVSDVLGIKRGHNIKTWIPRIGHLQYDFVVCSKDATVLAAIELEDTARRDKDKASADQIKDRASAAAGVRLLRWQARNLPAHAEIQAAFAVPLTQIFEDLPSNANASWWPPVSSAGRNPKED
jgi:hypothetical protein